MNDTILVTGAGGFIGTHLVNALLEAGHRVVRHSRQDGDIAVSPLQFEDVAHVFHLAARTFVPQSWEDPAQYYATNVLGTVNVLEFCRRSKATLTFVSSYVYGRPRRLPLNEDHPLEPFNPYSHTKIMAESVVSFYAEAFDVGVTIVRPFNVYGPGQSDLFLIPRIISQILDPAVPFIEIGDLRPRRDYIYVTDLLALLMATRQAPTRGTYNGGTGRSFSVAEVLESIRRITGIDKPVRSTGDSRANEILELVADVSRARRELNWRPVVALEDGLQQTVQWLRLNRAGRL